MAEALWTGVAEAYSRSFAGLCAGAVPSMLSALPPGGRLAEAGLMAARAGTTSWRWRVGAEDLWAGLTAVGGFGPTWRAQTPLVRDRLREAYDRLGAPWRDPADPDGGFAFDVTCVFVEARVLTP